MYKYKNKNENEKLSENESEILNNKNVNISKTFVPNVNQDSQLLNSDGMSVHKDDITNTEDNNESVNDSKQIENTSLTDTQSMLIHNYDNPIECKFEAFSVHELDKFLIAIFGKNSLEYTLVLAGQEAQSLLDVHDVFLNVNFRSIIKIDPDVLIHEGIVVSHAFEDNFDNETLFLSKQDKSAEKLKEGEVEKGEDIE